MNIYTTGFAAGILAITSVFANSEELVIVYPAGFIEFYKVFRSAVVSDVDGATVPLTCFPFQSTETGETIETKTISISQKKFKHLNLEKYYLTDLAGLISSSLSDGLPTKQIYMNAADFIKRNPDPGYPEQLTASSRNLFVVAPHSVVISNLTFSEYKNKWCWSGAETNEPISFKVRGR